MTATAPLPQPDPREWLMPAWRRDPSWEPEHKPMPVWEQCDRKRQAALRKAWAAGDLSWKLDSDQKKVYREIREWIAQPAEGRDRRGLRFMLDISRRYGKSTIMFLIAVEERIRNPREKRIAYWCDTRDMCERIIINEVYPFIFGDCPPEMRPAWYPSKHAIIWERDGKSLEGCRMLELEGLDDPNNCRGRSLYAGFFDECAFITKLEYIDQSIVQPMTLTVADAFLLFGSTPPVSPAHYFSAKLRTTCRAEGAYVHRTIFDNPRISTEKVEKYIADAGGIHSSTCKRELLAEHAPDETMAVVPEAEQAFKSGAIRPNGDPPQWRACYVAMDPGFSDATGVLFAYVDFERGEVVVEDEWLTGSVADQPSSVIANAIKRKERELWKDVFWWKDHQRQENPHRRWTDINHRLVADLQHDHDLSFAFTPKADLMMQINRVRVWVRNGTLRVHPRCEELEKHMRMAVFKNENRNSFARTPKHHFDLLAALIYLCRGVEPLMRRNPEQPYTYDQNKFFVMPESKHEQTKQALAERQRDRIARIRNRGGKRATSR